MDTWCEQLTLLSKTAKSELQASYAVFTGGFRHKLTYDIRTIPNIKQHLLQVDEVVLTKFIPAMTEGHICTPDEQDERLLLSLPVKKGGLAIPIFAEIADFEYENSQSTTHQLVRNIKCQESTAALDKELLKQTGNSIVKAREERNTTILQQLHGRMNKEQLRANELNTMRGASSWLTTLPVQSENLNLNKREFFDVLSLRYHWTPKYLPTTCRA